MSDRDSQMLEERIAGSTLSEIGDRHGLTVERVRQVTVAEGTKRINDLEIALMLAKKKAELGLEAEYPTFVVPFQEQEGWQLALGYFNWSVTRLRERGVPVKVTTRSTPQGLVFQLEERG